MSLEANVAGFLKIAEAMEAHGCRLISIDVIRLDNLRKYDKVRTNANFMPPTTNW